MWRWVFWPKLKGDDPLNILRDTAPLKPCFEKAMKGWGLPIEAAGLDPYWMANRIQRLVTNVPVMALDGTGSQSRTKEDTQARAIARALALTAH